MTMITPSYLGETIEYSSLHACRSTLEDPTQLRSGLPLRTKHVDNFHDLRGVAFDASPVKGGCGNAASPVVRLSIRRNQPFAEEDLHPLLRPVLAEGCGLVDQHFGDIGRIIQQHNVVHQDAIVRRAAETLQMLEQKNGVRRIKEAMKPVERQIEAQAGRPRIFSPPNNPRKSTPG